MKSGASGRIGALCLGGLLFLALGAGTVRVQAQQVDVPEPTFMQVPAPALYHPQFKGPDPFRTWTLVERNRQISILELDYNGTLSMGGSPMALFTWRGSKKTRYLLKGKKLFDGNNAVVDGVVGDITEKEVLLIQGNQRIPYSREQRRP
jgi:hypothetical protein